MNSMVNLIEVKANSRVNLIKVRGTSFFSIFFFLSFGIFIFPCVMLHDYKYSYEQL